MRKYIVFLMLVGLSAMNAQELNLLSTSPARNANYVPRDANIVLTFDENLDPATVNGDNIIIRGEQTGLIAGSFSVDGAVATFDPAADFKAGEMITVLATTHVQANDGAPLASAVSYQFSTQSDSAPEIPPFFEKRQVAGNISRPYSAFVADMDSDGDNDIVAAIYLDNSIVLYENDGNQSYIKHIVSTAVNGPVSVFAIDVDSDGDMDILSASETDSKIAWYKNNGNYSFSLRTISLNAVNAIQVNAADLDSDGDIDVLSASSGDNKIAWYENDGDEMFTEHIISTEESGALSLYVADLDNDGDNDILASSSNSNSVVWFENNSQSEFNKTVISSDSPGINSVFAIDIDQDADLDILTLAAGSDRIELYRNDGNTDFVKQIIINNVDDARALSWADVDGDNDTDLILIKEQSFIWYENFGDMNFTEHVIGGSPAALKDILATDMDSDGDIDIVTLVYEAGEDEISWYDNRADPQRLEPSVSNLAFGVVTAGNSAELDLVLRNPSTRNALEISAVDLVLAEISHDGGSVIIPPEDLVTVTVTFSPTASGVYEDTLRISSDDPHNPLYKIPVSGSASSNIVSGVISGDVTWTRAGSPYFVDGFLAVDAGASLTIEAGVLVEIDSMQKITVDGTLNVLGTEGDSVVIRGEGDDDFDQIHFRSGSGGTFSQFVIEKGTNAIFAENAGPDVSNGRVSMCEIGYQIINSSPIIEAMTFERNNQHGILIYDDAPRISNCHFINNGQTGVFAETGSIDVLASEFISNNIGINLVGYTYAQITNCTFNYNNTGLKRSDELTAFVQVVSIDNCHFESNTFMGIELEVDKTTIIGSSIINNGNFGISGKFDRIENSVISGNIAGGVNCVAFPPMVVNNRITYNGGNGYLGYINEFNGNTVIGNELDGVNTLINNSFSGNEIYGNGEDGIESSGIPNLTNNSIFSNEVYDFHATKESADIIDAENNWWGTTDSDEISAKIYDFYDDGSTVRVDFDPFLTQNLPLPNITGFRAIALANAALSLHWDAHIDAGQYLLFSNNGSAEVDTFTVWQTLDSTQTSYSTTLSNGLWRFGIRVKTNDRYSPIVYASANLDSDAPQIVSAYTVIGDSTVLITASEDLNMEVSGPAGNWAVTPGFSVSGVYTASTDLFVGKTDGKIEHYQNNGGLDFTLVSSNFQSIDVGSNAAPTFVDIDNDGDLDMFIGENGGKIHYYKNRSTDDTIDFDQISTNYNFIDVGSRSRPAFADLNNDGKYDLLIGNSSGKIYYYQNIGTPTDATFLLISDNAFDIDVGDDASLIFIDIDGDTDLDFFVGNSNGQIRYYRNIGGVDLPLFERAETYDSGYWTTISGNAIPAFTDIENDGDLDLFIGNPDAEGSANGVIHFIRNTGSFSNPNLILEDVDLADLDIAGLYHIAFAGLQNNFDPDQLVLQLDKPITTSAQELTVTATILEDVHGNAGGPVSFAFYPDDGNSNPSMVSLTLPDEPEGDTEVSFIIVDTEGDPVSLRCEYSIDDGANWQLISLTGDTSALDQSQYIGSIVWHTTDDLPGAETDSVRLRLTPRDNDPRNDGVSITSNYLFVDNNLPPVVEVYPLSGEQDGDIGVLFGLIDPENDMAMITAEYRLSDLAGTWQVATITGTTSFAPDDSLTLIWNSTADVPELAGNVWFRITPADNDPGSGDSTIIFVDNLGVPALQPLAALTGEQNGDITIQYQIIDDEGDPVSLLAEFSRDSLAWNLASISGDTSNITADAYLGQMTWHSATDLPGIDDQSVWFRIKPYDSNAGMAQLTNAFHLDNNLPPTLALGAMPESFGSLVDIPLMLNDAEGDELSLALQFQNDGSPWTEWQTLTAQSFSSANYNDTLTLAITEVYGFGIFTDLQIRLVALDNDSSAAATTQPLDVYALPGDFSGDIRIDYDDFVVFTQAWLTEDLSKDIGPATGTPPLLIPQPDGAIDFEDLMVFAQQWNWSYDNPEVSLASDKPIQTPNLQKYAASLASQSDQLAKVIAIDDPKPFAPIVPQSAEYQNIRFSQSDYAPWSGEFGQNLVFQYLGDAMPVTYTIDIEYPVDDLQISGYDNHFATAVNSFTLVGHNPATGQFTLQSARLEKTAAPGGGMLELSVKYLREGSVPVRLRWQLHGINGQLLSAGSMHTITTGHSVLPQQYQLHQNFPNPFNPTTTIRYELPRASKVQLFVFNVLGQQIATLVDGRKDAGYHEIKWNSAASGSPASGMYFLLMQAHGDAGANYKSVRKILLLK
jgi:hypothetical protein